MNVAPLASRAFVATLMSAVFACGFNPGPSAAAAEKTVRHAFKDPYKGGTRLSEGGGEPGMAYMALIDAVYQKDHAQICRLMADGEELAQCLKNKEATQGIVLLLGNPKAHKVLDGYLKGDEATLDVAYTWPEAKESYGFVVMKHQKGKWILSSFGGSGSADIDVEASGTKDLGSPDKGKEKK